MEMENKNLWTIIFIFIIIMLSVLFAYSMWVEHGKLSGFCIENGYYDFHDQTFSCVKSNDNTHTIDHREVCIYEEEIYWCD